MGDTAGTVFFGVLALGCIAAAVVWLIALRRDAPSWRDAFRNHEIQAFNAVVLVPAFALFALVGAIYSLDPSSRGALDWVFAVVMPVGLGAFLLIRGGRASDDA